MDRVIFLDIDGVLNSDNWNADHQTEINKGILVDREKIKLYRQLVEQTSARTVLHSGWKHWFDSELRPLRKEAQILLTVLQEEGLQIDNITPDISTEEIRRTKEFSRVKADEILAWLNDHNEVKEWVVIDDIGLHKELVRQHQIKPDGKVGIMPNDLDKALELLHAKIPQAKTGM